MKFNLKLISPKREIERNILSAMQKHLSSRLSGASLQKSISNAAKSLIVQKLTSSSTVSSLLTGDLRTEIGLPPGMESQVQSVINAIAENVEVTVSPAKIKSLRIFMTLTVKAIPSDISSITSGLGAYTTEKGQKIPWLSWLMEMGDAVIVRNYEAVAGYPKSSRTGDKIMIKSTGGWRVPPEHAGNPTNNFITRATDDILPELSDFISKSIRSLL